MGGEFRHVEVSLSIPDCEHLPRLADGRRMYADDVVQEVTAIIQGAVDSWYETRGYALLDTEPYTL